MENKDIPIGAAARRLGVSIDTLRRWDEAGKLKAFRKSPGGTRYYNEGEIEVFLHELFGIALDWASKQDVLELPSQYYCENSSVFKARLIRMQNALLQVPDLSALAPLISAITGEIGSNSFDHNIGNWPDMLGIFFGYDLQKKQIVLADRGLGVLTTLKRVRPKLVNASEALVTAFTEFISGRPTEGRGNGLKFVKKVIAENPISLEFESGDAEAVMQKESSDFVLRNARVPIRGCLALINF